MTRPLRIQYPGACYHVTCRGIERRRIFADDRDRIIFCKKLALSRDVYSVLLLAYVCMPNHFHLLIKTPHGNLSEFMRHFNISYTAFFNRRHRRVGNLYQGRYKAFLIDVDNYLLEVSRYIHLNPIRIKSIADKSADERIKILTSYKWSSLHGYLWPGKRENFVTYATTLDYLGGDSPAGRQAYKQFLFSGISSEAESPLALGSGHGIIGDEGFIKWVKDTFLENGLKERERPAVRELKRQYPPQELIEQYLQLIGGTREEICRRGRHLPERTILMELLYRFCRITQQEIGSYMGGLDYSSVSNVRRRLLSRIGHDQQLERKFNAFLKHFNQMKS